MKYRSLLKILGSITVIVSSVTGASAAEWNTSPPAAPAEPTTIQELEEYRLLKLKAVHFTSGKDYLSPEEILSVNDLAARFCCQNQINQIVIELRAYADGAKSHEQNVDPHWSPTFGLDIVETGEPGLVQEWPVKLFTYSTTCEMVTDAPWSPRSCPPSRK